MIDEYDLLTDRINTLTQLVIYLLITCALGLLGIGVLVYKQASAYTHYAHGLRTIHEILMDMQKAMNSALANQEGFREQINGMQRKLNLYMEIGRGKNKKNKNDNTNQNTINIGQQEEKVKVFEQSFLQHVGKERRDILDKLETSEREKEEMRRMMMELIKKNL